MDKKKYESPILNIEIIGEADVILTSNSFSKPDEEGIEDNILSDIFY